MNKFFASLSACALMISCQAFSAAADDYVVVEKPAKIFDTPNAKGYVTLNSKNEEVCIAEGMVFKTLESGNGWHLVEYSPGLRGYLSEQVTSSKNILPKAGIYKVSNSQNRQIEVSCQDNIWKATIDGRKLTGKVFSKVVVFFNENGQPAYSLVDLGKGAIVHTYDNSVTKFF